MIDIREYRKFKKLAGVSRRMFINRMTDRLVNGTVTFPINTDKGTIWFRAYDQPRYLEYFWHRQFGVLRCLSNDGMTFDRTPFCEELETRFLTL